jgi:hypothetical protein
MMGGACSTNEGRRGMHVGYWESQKEKGKGKVIPVQAVEALRVARS